MDLRPFQREFIAELLRTDAGGRRTYRTALLGMPRGNGKTELAAALALYLLDADPNAEIILAAGSRDQASIAWRAAAAMVMRSKDLSARFKVLRGNAGRIIRSRSGDAFLQAVSADAGLQHGLRPTAVIFDELWLQKDALLWDALRGGLVKAAEPLLLAITTAGFDSDSLLYELCKQGEAGEEGFLYRWYSAPPEADWRDPATWKLANPAMACRRPFLRPQGLRDNLKFMHESEFRRWHLNQWTDAEAQWMARELWEACAAPDRADAADRWVLGFDGSSVGDATALVAVSVEERPHVEVIQWWQPTAAAAVPVLDVEEAIRRACRDRQVVKVVADPFRWQRSLQVLAGEGFPIEEFPQAPARLTPATARFYEGVQNRAITHDGNADLAAHISHCVIHQDARGIRLVKDKLKSTRRIDLAMAALMAFDRASDLATKVLTFY
ncbi:MAG: terminase large subunit [Actinomycetota bacterium]|nr:terminase large subunit [Actinomycetota bacterium]